LVPGRDFVRLGNHLGEQIGPVDEALPRIVIGVDDADVGLRLVVAAAQLEAGPLRREQRRSVLVQGCVEQSLEIAGDAVVSDGGRRHHHGDTRL
jgi:hypothetical protein